MNTLNIAVESANRLCEDLQRTIAHDTRNPLLAEIVLDQITLARGIQQKLERCASLMPSFAPLPLTVAFCAWCADPNNPSPLSHPNRQVEHAPPPDPSMKIQTPSNGI